MNSTVQGRPDLEDAIPPHLGRSGASTSITLQRIRNKRKTSTNTKDEETQKQIVDFMASFAETSKNRFILEVQREKLEEERHNKREKREEDRHNMNALRELRELGKDLEDAEMKLLKEKDEGVKNILKNSVKRIQENYDSLHETLMKNK